MTLLPFTDEQLAAAIARLGGPQGLARAAGLSYNTVWTASKKGTSAVAPQSRDRMARAVLALDKPAKVEVKEAPPERRKPRGEVEIVRAAVVSGPSRLIELMEAEIDAEEDVSMEALLVIQGAVGLAIAAAKAQKRAAKAERTLGGLKAYYGNGGGRNGG